MAEYSDIAQLIGKKVKPFTPPLFYDDHSNNEIPPSAFASSILIKTDSNFFLVTAAHVFYKEDINNIGFFINKFFYVIVGELNFHEPNDDFHDPQNLDLAVFKLDYVMVDLLKNYYSFLEFQYLELDHFSSINSCYWVFGYPAEMTKANQLKKTIVPVSMTFQTIGVDLYYYQTNIDIEKIIVLSGDQNKIQPVNNNSQFLLSEFTGISGCGVWHVTCFSLECPEYKLVSIITGEDKNKTVFYSTRVNAIFSILMLNNWLV